MEAFTKSTARRQEIRKNRPDASRYAWSTLKERGIPQAVAIVLGFFVVATGIMMLRQDVLGYRTGQPITHDIVSRVGFRYFDRAKLQQAEQQARAREPEVYSKDETLWEDLRKDLVTLPERAAAVKDAGDTLKPFDEAGARSVLLAATSAEGKRDYLRRVESYISLLNEYRNPDSKQPLIVIKAEDRQRLLDQRLDLRIGSDVVDVRSTYAVNDGRLLTPIVRPLAEQSFPLALQGKIAEYTLMQLRPTHTFDEPATTLRRNQAVKSVAPQNAMRNVQPNEILVTRSKGWLDDTDVSLLRAENEAFNGSLKGSVWKPTVGILAATLIVTCVLAAYVALFQRRVVKNLARGLAIALLLLAMLLLAALAGVGSGPIYLFGTAPTLLVAMILAIAYDRRFAIGVASLQAMLVTLALSQTAEFFLVLWVGILTAGMLLDDVRTRSKLVEVGGASALAMMFATGAAGLLALESGQFVLRNCLYAGAAGLTAGFVVLGILPFIEKMFRITTSMTLLELADASQPLLRRLQLEAPGTYNHSLQVANLGEAAADAIGADSLLCRVAAYYHDVGKINKPDYFVENQADGRNRHLNLDPNLSLLIIVGHVKDGVELAREYNLPTSITQFIQQHHGTTVVEYFYRRACSQQEQRDPRMAVPESQFRYPGPRPRSKEIAIVMLADAVESATRCLEDPSPAQIEGLVRDLAMKRLLDKQFDECDLTLRELEQVQKSLVRTLAGIYHGRIPYPPAQPTTSNPETMQATTFPQAQTG